MPVAGKRKDVAWRVLAFLTAISLTIAALAGVGYLVLMGGISAQAPDPSILDGDPCCGHPDTWGEVADGVAWTLGGVIVDGLLVAGAVALYCWSATGSWPRWERLSLIPLGGFGASVVVFTAVLVPKLDEGRERPSAPPSSSVRLPGIATAVGRRAEVPPIGPNAPR